MTSMTDKQLRYWWDAQPDQVRAVLDLAYEQEHDAATRILATFGAGEHAAAIDALRTDLVWIDRLRADEPHEVLSAYYDKQWHGWDGDLIAEQEADDLRASVLTRAQLVASLICRAVAA